MKLGKIWQVVLAIVVLCGDLDGMDRIDNADDILGIGAIATGVLALLNK